MHLCSSFTAPFLLFGLQNLSRIELNGSDPMYYLTDDDQPQNIVGMDIDVR